MSWSYFLHFEFSEWPDYFHISGFFHKRHVRKSAGAITAECTYTCHRCQNGMSTKVVAKRGKTGTKGGKLQTQKRKKASKVSRPVRLKGRKKVTKVVQVRSRNSKKVPASVPLRRSPRKAKGLSLQNKKLEQRKKGKKIKSKKTTFQKPKRTASWRKKRTHIYHSYWLNGLRLSRKPNDERVTHFREKNIHSSSENLSVSLDQPKCLICCEARCSSTLNYIVCEICKGTLLFTVLYFFLFWLTLSFFNCVFSYLMLMRNRMHAEGSYPFAINH